MSVNPETRRKLAQSMSDCGAANDLCDVLDAAAASAAGSLAANNTWAGANDFAAAVTVSAGGLTLSNGMNLAFTGLTAQCEVELTDNLADALSVKITGGADFIVIDTTNSNEKLYLVPASGQKLSFFNVTAVARQSAYTQTYATADRTHADPTAAALTAADGAGTNDNAIGAITADASVIAAVQEIVDEINKLVADVADVKQLANSIIDDLQAYGLAQ